jgi:hypothetical protein
VGILLTNRCAISLVELLNFFKESRRLRDKSAFDQKRLNVFELVLFGECRDIGEQFSFRNADKWVANLSLNIGSQLSDARFAVGFEDRGAALLVLVGHDWIGLAVFDVGHGWSISR